MWRGSVSSPDGAKRHPRSSTRRTPDFAALNPGYLLNESLSGPSFRAELDCLGVAAAAGYGQPWIAFARQKFTGSGFDERSNHFQ
jgi:hypothetical protein